MSSQLRPTVPHTALLLLLGMMLLQLVVLHLAVHSVVSQVGRSVLHAALLPWVRATQALGSGGRYSDESRLAA